MLSKKLVPGHDLHMPRIPLPHQKVQGEVISWWVLKSAFPGFDEADDLRGIPRNGRKPLPSEGITRLAFSYWTSLGQAFSSEQDPWTQGLEELLPILSCAT